MVLIIISWKEQDLLFKGKRINICFVISNALHKRNAHSFSSADGDQLLALDFHGIPFERKHDKILLSLVNPFFFLKDHCNCLWIYL